jgi:hypothetical protein
VQVANVLDHKIAIFSKKKYDQLREFSFDNVFDELAQTRPFLLDWFVGALYTMQK